MPDTLNTPEALLELSDALSDFSDKLDDYIKDAPDPYVPEMIELRTLDGRIAMDAKIIAGIAADLAAPGVVAAIADLKVQVGKAKETLEQINDAKVALSLVASVLSAAAAISTGNPLAAAPAVIGLVNGVVGAIYAAQN
jgi:hypothetical protein